MATSTEDHRSHAAVPASARLRGGRMALTSLVFPTYHPGPQIHATMDAVDRFLAAESNPWEILFVCDGDDGAAQLLRNWSDERPNVRVVAYPQNRGKGYAVRTGLSAARGAWRIFTDVDLAYGFDDVVRVAEALWAGADAAIASRSHPDARVELPPDLLPYLFGRHLQSKAFSFAVRRLLGISQRDTQAGLKGVSAAAWEWIHPQLQCDGFEFDCELLAVCGRLAVEVAELPVHVRYDSRNTTVSRAAGWKMLRSLLAMRKRLANVGTAGGTISQSPLHQSRAA